MIGENYQKHDQKGEEPRGAVARLNWGGHVVGPAFMPPLLAPPLRAEQIPDDGNAGEPEKINSSHVEAPSFQALNIAGLKRGFKSIAGGTYAL